MNSSQQQSVTVFNKGKSKAVSDLIAVEEPLEIRLRYHDDTGSLREQSISVTMRTPGDDISFLSRLVVESPFPRGSTANETTVRLNGRELRMEVELSQ